MFFQLQILQKRVILTPACCQMGGLHQAAGLWLNNCLCLRARLCFLDAGRMGGCRNVCFVMRGCCSVCDKMLCFAVSVWKVAKTAVCVRVLGYESE